jgi:hypothetical protein
MSWGRNESKRTTRAGDRAEVGVEELAGTGAEEEYKLGPSKSRGRGPWRSTSIRGSAARAGTRSR